MNWTLRFLPVALAAVIVVASPVTAAISPAAKKPQTPAAKPIDVEKVGATGAMGVFINCAHFGSDVKAVRDWAVQSGLTEAPPDMAKPFLMGKPGKAYGGTTMTGDLVIVSRNDGSCSVFAGHADSTGIVAEFEAWLADNKFSFTPPKPRTTTSKAGITVVSRDYAIHGDGVHWHAIISTVVQGNPRFQAIMTAYRAHH